MKSALRGLKPIASPISRMLILGSFPSVKSLEKKEYYANPQNHFWRIMAAIGKRPVPEKDLERKGLLRCLRAAIWDVARFCRRRGSSDNQIGDVTPNDIPEFLRRYPKIKKIFLNGRKAEALYLKHFKEKIKIEAYYLPSTSPAHAAMSFQKKLESWKKIARIKGSATKRNRQAKRGL